jgi:hypothetical protein
VSLSCHGIAPYLVGHVSVTQQRHGCRTMVICSDRKSGSGAEPKILVMYLLLCGDEA